MEVILFREVPAGLAFALAAVDLYREQVFVPVNYKIMRDVDLLTRAIPEGATSIIVEHFTPTPLACKALAGIADTTLYPDTWFLTPAQMAELPDNLKVSLPVRILETRCTTALTRMWVDRHGFPSSWVDRLDTQGPDSPEWQWLWAQHTLGEDRSSPDHYWRLRNALERGLTTNEHIHYNDYADAILADQRENGDLLSIAGVRGLAMNLPHQMHHLGRRALDWQIDGHPVDLCMAYTVRRGLVRGIAYCSPGKISAVVAALKEQYTFHLDFKPVNNYLVFAVPLTRMSAVLHDSRAELDGRPLLRDKRRTNKAPAPINL